MAEPLSIKDALEPYESGKHRRYNLLFSVNGGAFLVAKLLVEEGARPDVVLGGLTLDRLALGMVLFTVVMVADIFMFGMKLRQLLEGVGGPSVFGGPGRVVLILLGALIVAGWLLVGFVPAPG